ncbi:MAG: hypothetical protein IJ774_09400 [Selenomonadaceae bacterium]|nr:hypothetical protein [Selenomonadaceae bacterium]
MLTIFQPMSQLKCTHKNKTVMDDGRLLKILFDADETFLTILQIFALV